MPRWVKLAIAAVVPSVAGALAWWICATRGLGLDVTSIVVGLIVLLPATPLGIWASQAQPGADARTIAPPASPAAPALIGDLPRAPRAYQPRRDLHDRIEKALADTRPAVCALAGGRGVGKTHLAAACALDYLARRIPVAWLHAETPEQLRGSLDLMAAELGLRSDTDDADAVARKIRIWLGQRPDPCLVVFDNAVDPDALAPVLPAHGPARVLITTNYHSFERVATLIPVDRFTTREALAYMRGRLDRDVDWDDADAGRLVEELDRLPLALSIAAAALIGPPRSSMASYLLRLRATSIDVLLERPQGEPYPTGVGQAIMLSAGRADVAARRLLGELSLLSASGVALNLFGTDLDTSGALSELATGSLVTFSRDNTTVYVHRLVRRAVRDQAARDGTLAGLIEAAADRLGVSIHAIADKDTWREFPTIMATADHAAALWQAVEQLPDQPAAQAVAELVLRVQHAVARHLLYLNDDLRAIPIAEALAAGYAERFGPDDPGTLSALITLARTYETTDVARSLELHEHVLAERIRVLGDDHLDTLWSRGAAAAAHGRAGRIGQALDLLELVVADQERLLPADHPALMQTRFSQAALTIDAGDADLGATRFARLAADQERLFGPDDPDVQVIRGHVARAYVAAGRPDEAIALYERVIVDQERIIGAEHPDTMITRHGLAAAYQAAGRIEDAIAEYGRAVTGFEATLGPEHSLSRSARTELERLPAAQETHA
ncbi:tetratricopeptide repeat-containing protein [Streptosporangiaceae bacterium NEAU-GS5]|nr:tetratricopeptide repeat-containing protein [Streptosporangiaceae bacterium NEAU-GS5]